MVAEVPGACREHWKQRRGVCNPGRPSTAAQHMVPRLGRLGSRPAACRHPPPSTCPTHPQERSTSDLTRAELCPGTSAFPSVPKHVPRHGARPETRVSQPSPHSQTVPGAEAEALPRFLI